MGEARRRKLAGTYPKPGDPFDEVRRFWCGRSPGPVEDFQAPVGTVAVTLDVQGAAPSTCVLDAAKVTDAIGEVNRLSAGMDYYEIVRLVAAEFLKAKQTGDDNAYPWIGLACLWTALHHPKSGADMRKAVSGALRRDGKAHITWQFSPTIGLAMALAERFVDLEGLAALAPKDSATTYVEPRDEDAQH